MYIKDVVFLRAARYDLGACHILPIPKCNTTSYGLTWVRYLGPNFWNSLKDNIRLSQDLSSFKNIIFKIDFAGVQSSSSLIMFNFIFFLKC